MSEAPTITGTVDLIAAPSRLIESGVGEFAKVLPRSLPPEKFARWGLNVLKNGLLVPHNATDYQRKQAEQWQRVLAPANEAGRLSVMAALLDCAALGLEPGRTFHLVPFGGMVSGITDYKGEIQLIDNARKHTHVIAALVRDGDDVVFNGAWSYPLVGSLNPFSGTEVVGGYAFTVTEGQLSSMVVTMGRAEFDKHEEKGGPVWKQWRDSMQLKTLVHQVRKVVPWSAERQWT